MSGVNKVIVIGNLGKDPEIRYTQGGDAVANFSVATSETWKDKSGTKQEQTEWHNIVAWRKLAEICGEYLKKGSKVFVMGKLQTRKWQDKDGNDRYTTEIVASEMQMLDSRPAHDQQAKESRPREEAPQGGGIDPNDEIPFMPRHWLD